jgi:hypothetical protein
MGRLIQLKNPRPPQATLSKCQFRCCRKSLTFAHPLTRDSLTYHSPISAKRIPFQIVPEVLQGHLPIAFSPTSSSLTNRCLTMVMNRGPSMQSTRRQGARPVIQRRNPTIEAWEVTVHGSWNFFSVYFPPPATLVGKESYPLSALR